MQAVLLAAGRSTRFWPFDEDHKSAWVLAGKPIIAWTIESLAKAGVEEVVVVHSLHSRIPNWFAENPIEGMKLHFAVQEEALGTGNALAQAREFIKGPFALVWPDMINAGALVQKMVKTAQEEDAQGVIATAQTAQPHLFGILRIEGKVVEEIVEKPTPEKAPSNFKRFGVEMFGGDFFEYYDKVKHHETDLINAINLYAQEKKVVLCELKEDVAVLKYPWDVLVILKLLAGLLQGRISNEAQVAQSATIEGEVIIEAGARIGEGVFMYGPAYIGENCIIGDDTRIRGPVIIERDVVVGKGSEIRHSCIGAGTIAQTIVLPDSVVGPECQLGNGFTATSMRDDGHSVQVSVKGERVDTGRTALGALIGSEASFNMHTGTLPGVLVGRNARVDAGVQVSENVANNTELSSHLMREEEE